jgi:hypothetical protein
MKKILPHIVLILALIAALVLILTNKPPQKLDERLSFRYNDKRPYGHWVAYNNLSHLFPGAGISTNRKGPGYWDSLSAYEKGQALIICSPYFFPDREEMDKLMNFVRNGNDVFISTVFISEAAQDILGVNTSFYDYSYLITGRRDDDTLRVSLQPDSSGPVENFEYPGRRLSTHLSETDEERTYTLGYDYNNRKNFIRMRAGSGNLYLHTAPLAFSNYFLLHKNNIRYYETALSFINKDSRSVVWDEYFLSKKYNPGNRPDDEKGFMSVLFRFPGLKWAFIASMILLLLYVLSEMRRKQRYIPVVKKPANDSLEFVKTTGRLYFEKADHRNLCRKMGTYFMEHIRHRYNLVTSQPDDNFIKALQYKSGHPENDLKNIIYFINNIESVSLNDSQLKAFHRSLEDFYAKT